MNQLSVPQKRFPRSQQDIRCQISRSAQVLHRAHSWTFTEGRNIFQSRQPHAHRLGRLASHAHTENKGSVGAAILMDDGTMMTGRRAGARTQASAKLSRKSASSEQHPASGVPLCVHREVRFALSSAFGFRLSDFFRISTFGFRTFGVAKKSEDPAAAVADPLPFSSDPVAFLAPSGYVSVLGRGSPNPIYWFSDGTLQLNSAFPVLREIIIVLA